MSVATVQGYGPDATYVGIHEAHDPADLAGGATVTWCTGFRPALRHLRDLGLRDSDGHIPIEGPMVTSHPGLYLVGYGDWTGPASATLIGVGQSVKWAVARIQEYLDLGPPTTTSQCR